MALTGADPLIDVARVEPGTPSGRRERFAIMARSGSTRTMMRDAPVKLKASFGWAAYLVSAVGAHVDHGHTTF